MEVRKVAWTLPEESYGKVERKRAVELRSRSEAIEDAFDTAHG